MDKDKDAVINQGEVESGCGNTVCESLDGETKETCPQDCSGGN